MRSLVSSRVHCVGAVRSASCRHIVAPRLHSHIHSGAAAVAPTPQQRRRRRQQTRSAIRLASANVTTHAAANAAARAPELAQVTPPALDLSPRTR